MHALCMFCLESWHTLIGCSGSALPTLVSQIGGLMVVLAADGSVLVGVCGFHAQLLAGHVRVRLLNVPEEVD